MAIEYEIKIRGELGQLTEALGRIGAQAQGPRVLEDDLVLDTDEGRILHAGGLLRLRRRGEFFLLTLKGVSEEHGEVKAMTEVETEVADGAATRTLLEQLGFGVALRYQKYRTRFSCPVRGCESLVLTLDETPLGAFLEIEGAPEQIHRCAEALGYEREAYDTRSYLEIHRLERGVGDMLFEGPEAAPWSTVAGQTGAAEAGEGS